MEITIGGIVFEIPESAVQHLESLILPDDLAQALKARPDFYELFLFCVFIAEKYGDEGLSMVIQVLQDEKARRKK